MGLEAEKMNILLGASLSASSPGFFLLAIPAVSCHLPRPDTVSPISHHAQSNYLERRKIQADSKNHSDCHVEVFRIIWKNIFSERKKYILI